MKSKRSNPALKILSALSLPLLLSSCAHHTETVSTVSEPIFPPAGMIVPCEKPLIIGTWPEIITNDIPKLKRALSECASQTEEYLQWRTEREQTENNTRHQ